MELRAGPHLGKGRGNTRKKPPGQDEVEPGAAAEFTVHSSDVPTGSEE